jgi:DNA-binding GntR family transcriptional regulator
MPSAPVSSPTATTSTQTIVHALQRAIVEHRLQPGAKLAEQQLADTFGVSRTLVRQALIQLEQRRLVRLEPARGAFVAAPSATEAAEVFAVRRMLEGQLVRTLAAQASHAQIKALRQHLADEKAAVAADDTDARSTRVELLGDFHVLLAEQLGNGVLVQLLQELISRCALITLMYQSAQQAADSHGEHAAIVRALAAHDAERAAELMDAHLLHIQNQLTLNQPVPTHDVRQALAALV